MRRERWVSVGPGVNLYAVELGLEDAPPLVVLHGGPAAHHEYLLPGFARLADTRRLVLYDQRGGGRSRVDPGVDVGWRAQVGDVEAVVASVGAPVDLAGYSFGGLYALLFAARRPEQVRRLVLVSSAPPAHGYQADLERALAAAQADPLVAGERAALEASGLRESLPDEYRRRRFALSVAGYFADPRLAHGLTPFKVQARTAEEVRASLGAYDFSDQLAAVPGDQTLVIHGERDPIAPALLADLAARIGARFELLPGCGHVPYVEAPERFFAIMRAFLGDAP